jgi:uncharacterized membrane protein (DUF2068 family)
VTALRAIAAFKLAKAIMLLALGIASLTMLRTDVREAISRWGGQLHLDPDGRLTRLALERVAALSPHRMRALATGMFVYAGLLTVEGVGLALGKRWAEYVTVFITASLLPLEFYEIARHPTLTRTVVLVVNVGIVAYLIARLRRGR